KYPNSSLCLHFLIQCPDDHQLIHPFPTRRSSDLKYDAIKAFRLLSHFHQEGLEDTESAVHYLNNFAMLIILQSIMRYRSYKSILDRKSTRLNSSHVSKSYAVFCLKIKTLDYLRLH